MKDGKSFQKNTLWTLIQKHVNNLEEKKDSYPRPKGDRNDP